MVRKGDLEGGGAGVEEGADEKEEGAGEKEEEGGGAEAAQKGGDGGDGATCTRLLVCSGRWNQDFCRMSAPSSWLADKAVNVSVVRLLHPSHETMHECVQMVLDALSSEQHPPVDMVFGVSDDPMVVLGVMRGDDQYGLSEDEKALLASFPLYPTLLTTDKFAARELLRECSTVPHGAITRDHTAVPEIPGADKLIIKPLAGCGSVGVLACHAGTLIPDDFAHGAEDDIVWSLCREHLGGTTGAAIGLVEEYLDVQKLSVDGYVCANGKTQFWSAHNNVMHADAPEVLDYLGLPATGLSDRQHDAVVAKMHRMLKELWKTGQAYNQFFNVEMFVFPESGDPEEAVRIEIMEVNCRVGVNYLPIFELALGMSVFEAEERIRQVTPDTPLPEEDPTAFDYPVSQILQHAVTIYCPFNAPESVYRRDEFPQAFLVATGGISHTYAVHPTPTDEALAQARGLTEWVRKNIVGEET